jgi:hypothetical protein
LLAATWSTVAVACPVCFSAKGEANRVAFVVTTCFMSALPLSMIGAFIWWAARRLRESERTNSHDPYRMP